MFFLFNTILNADPLRGSRRFSVDRLWNTAAFQNCHVGPGCVLSCCSHFHWYWNTDTELLCCALLFREKRSLCIGPPDLSETFWWVHFQLHISRVTENELDPLWTSALKSWGLFYSFQQVDSFLTRIYIHFYILIQSVRKIHASCPVGSLTNTYILIFVCFILYFHYRQLLDTSWTTNTLKIETLETVLLWLLSIFKRNQENRPKLAFPRCFLAYL